MCDDVRSAVCVLVLSAFLGTPTNAQTFAELDPFVGDTFVVTGSVAGVGWSIEIVDTPDTDFVWRGDLSVFDNSSELFAGSAYTPSTAGADAIRFSMFSTGTLPDARTGLTVRFDRPVRDPVLHYWQLDRSGWDFAFSAAAGHPPERVSGNSEFVVVDDQVLDADPGTTEEQSAYGSVRFPGLVAEIRGELFENGIDIGDGLALQISLPTGQPCVFADLSPAYGSLNVDDVDVFATAFLVGDLLADCDGSGVINIDDIDCFVASFLGGCP